MQSASATPTAFGTDERAPEPLEFLTREAIHPANAALKQKEADRWRLLTMGERARLRGYVRSLALQLKRGKWNAHHLRLADLYEAWKAEAKIVPIGDDERRERDRRMKAIRRERAAIIRALRPLKEPHLRFEHYVGWLAYERSHRKQLREQAKLEARIRRDMRREAKWLETLIRDVWRKTPGCHHIYSDRKGKEIVKVPKFERSGISTDAHYFHLAASRRTLLGWRWLLPYTVLLKRLYDDDVMANIRAATRRQVDVLFSETGAIIFRVSRLDSPDALPSRVLWRDAMRLYDEKQRDRFVYPLSVRVGRKFAWRAVVDAPNMLVAGTTQSGKSNFVNGVIGCLASTHSPAEMRIVLIDMKGGMEFTHWRLLPHILGEMVKSLEDVEPTLSEIVRIMRERQGQFERALAKDLASYNRRVDPDQRMARIFVVLDEMNTFLGQGSLTRKIHNLLTLLASQGRAVGINVITSTQYPTKDVVPTPIKANMETRASGYATSVVASMVILDLPDAHYMKALPGRFAIADGMAALTVQVPYISNEDIAGVVAAARARWPSAPPAVPGQAGPSMPVVVAAPAAPVWDHHRFLCEVLTVQEGALSGERLHHAMGDRSPGERALRRLSREIRARISSGGGAIVHEGVTYIMTTRGKGAYLIAQPGAPDATDAPDTPAAPADTSDQTSERDTQ